MPEMVNLPVERMTKLEYNPPLFICYGLRVDGLLTSQEFQVEFWIQLKIIDENFWFLASFVPVRCVGRMWVLGGDKRGNDSTGRRKGSTEHR